MSFVFSPIRVRRILTAGVLGPTFVACAESRTTAPLQSPSEPSRAALPISGTCGIEYRMIISETDSLIATYDSPTTVDTVDVCGTWTGSDYFVRTTLVGSSDRLNGELDEVNASVYSGNGVITSFRHDGTPASSTESIESTLFDLMSADVSQRQAAADNPYHAVYAEAVTPAATSTSTTSTSTTSAKPACVAKAGGPKCPANLIPATFTQHQLSRPGVRALLNSASEIAKSPEGYRQFRSTYGNETVIRSIDPVSQLVMREETMGPSGNSLANHEWRATGGGFVRARSTLQANETIDGRSVHTITRIQFDNVRINGAPAR